MNPIAKKDGLLVETIGDDIVVLDQNNNRAHRLNRTMAFVWQQCDGQHSPANMLKALRHDLNFEAADEHVVDMALDQLNKLSLIEFHPPQHTTQLFSRRDLARKLAVATALLPSILSITVPTPAQAKSVSEPSNASTEQKASTGGGDSTGSGERHFDPKNLYFGRHDEDGHGADHHNNDRHEDRHDQNQHDKSSW